VPIVSISKIQNRYGLSENLPQLSAAELGWAIDTRRLYVGNGPISEGAPIVGNTEILTEYSDILAISDAYQYKGLAAGYTHQTGTSINSPTTRTLQSKLDDFASVKDFGAAGDGVTDDTAAINRALFQVFCRETNEEIRRSLFFPAGVYKVSDLIEIPTYAKLVGEGKNCSIIRQTLVSPGIALADSFQQTGVNIGNGGATIPSFIEINDLSFENIVDGDVVGIDSAVNCIFRRVEFKGSKTTIPTGVGTNFPACLKLTSTPINQTKNIVFEQCDFTNNNFAVVADDDMQALLFNGCKFDSLYKGFKLGENTSGSGSSIVGPRGVKITNSVFDNIYNTGIHVYDISGVVSAYNYFADVGNSLNGAGNPTADVIIFAQGGNYSIADIFERPESDLGTYSRVNLDGYEVYFLVADVGIRYGYHQTEAGKSLQLADNTGSATSTTITFDAVDQKTNLIYYTASRGSNVRHGVMRVTASASGSTLTDDFNEDGASIGLTFSLNVSGGITTLRYTTTNTGNPVTFKYRVERLV
jgi:hypothetical protein